MSITLEIISNVLKMRNFDAKNLFTVDMRVGMVYTRVHFPQ